RRRPQHQIVRGLSPMKLRFTIRELFWMAAIVALALGWKIDHIRIEQDQREAQNCIRYFTTARQAAEDAEKMYRPKIALLEHQIAQPALSTGDSVQPDRLTSAER